MSETLDMEHRDPKVIYDPDTFRVAYQSVFAEPDPGVHSFNGIWKAAYVVYSAVRLWTYRILSICGVCAACCWGLEFGCTACCTIWCWTPCLRLYKMNLYPLKTCLTIYLDAVYRPCINLVSYLLWNIRVTMTKQDGPTHHV